MEKVSVFIQTTEKRIGTIRQVVESWLEQPQVSEVVLCIAGNAMDHVGAHVVDLDFDRIKYFTAYPDPGNKMRHCLAILAQEDYVIQADDDFVVHPGFLFDYFKKYEQLCHSLKVGPTGIITGLIGRSFVGPNYYQDALFYSAQKITNTTFVDFVGVMYLCHKDLLLGFDVARMPNHSNDLYWQIDCLPLSVHRAIIPTKLYENLDCCNDDTSLFHNKQARTDRIDYFKNQLWPKLKFNKDVV